MDAFGRITKTTGSAMCTLCGYTSRIETDVDRAEGVATAAVFALHFMTVHPEVSGGVSRYLVMTPDPEEDQ